QDRRAKCNQDTFGRVGDDLCERCCDARRSFDERSHGADQLDHSTAQVAKCSATSGSHLLELCEALAALQACCPVSERLGHALQAAGHVRGHGQECGYQSTTSASDVLDCAQEVLEVLAGELGKILHERLEALRLRTGLQLQDELVESCTCLLDARR